MVEKGAENASLVLNATGIVGTSKNLLRVLPKICCQHFLEKWSWRGQKDLNNKRRSGKETEEKTSHFFTPPEGFVGAPPPPLS